MNTFVKFTCATLVSLLPLVAPSPGLGETEKSSDPLFSLKDIGFLIGTDACYENQSTFVGCFRGLQFLSTMSSSEPVVLLTATYYYDNLRQTDGLIAEFNDLILARINKPDSEAQAGTFSLNDREAMLFQWLAPKDSPTVVEDLKSIKSLYEKTKSNRSVDFTGIAQRLAQDALSVHPLKDNMIGSTTYQIAMVNARFAAGQDVSVIAKPFGAQAAQIDEAGQSPAPKSEASKDFVQKRKGPNVELFINLGQQQLQRCGTGLGCFDQPDPTRNLTFAEFTLPRTNMVEVGIRIAPVQVKCRNKTKASLYGRYVPDSEYDSNTGRITVENPLLLDARGRQTVWGCTLAYAPDIKLPMSFILRPSVGAFVYRSQVTLYDGKILSTGGPIWLVEGMPYNTFNQNRTRVTYHFGLGLYKSMGDWTFGVGADCNKETRTTDAFAGGDKKFARNRFCGNRALFFGVHRNVNFFN